MIWLRNSWFEFRALWLTIKCMWEHFWLIAGYASYWRVILKDLICLFIKKGSIKLYLDRSRSMIVDDWWLLEVSSRFIVDPSFPVYLLIIDKDWAIFLGKKGGTVDLIQFFMKLSIIDCWELLIKYIIFLIVNICGNKVLSIFVGIKCIIMV